MRNHRSLTLIAAFACAILAGPACTAAQGNAAAQMAAPPAAPAADWTAVDQAFGRPGTAMPGDVNRYAFPRSDLSVVAHGVPIKPAFALGGWLAFRMTAPREAMVMGDLVLLETEIAPVVAALQAGGISQTALHNHMNGEQPAVWYLHVNAHGDPATIARAARKALETTMTPLATPGPAVVTTVDLDTAAMNRAIGVAGRVTGGVVQYSVARVETIMQGGHEVPPAMGTSTPINFQPTGGGKAAILGDFVTLADEANAVIKVLSDGGIAITSMHSHMTDELPRLTMIHFWANDDAVKLARVLGAALDKTKSKRVVAR